MNRRILGITILFFTLIGLIAFKSGEERKADNPDSIFGPLSSMGEEEYKKYLGYLDDVNFDFSIYMAEQDTDKVDEIVGASSKLINEVSKCISDGTHCDQGGDDWAEYFAIGGPPLHQKLVHAMEVMRMSGEDVSRSDLFSIMKADSFDLSYSAATLALERSKDIDEAREVLEESESLRFEAKARFLKFYAETIPGDEKLTEALVDSLGASSDSYTRSEIISRIDEYHLDKFEYIQVAVAACDGVQDTYNEGAKARVQGQLYRKARSQGFMVSKSQLCSLPPGSLED